MQKFGAFAFNLGCWLLQLPLVCTARVIHNSKQGVDAQGLMHQL